MSGCCSGHNTASVSAASAAAFGIPAGFYGPLAKLVDETYTEFLPRLIVQYDFNDDLMGYASYSKGINVGVNTFNTAFLSLPAFALAVPVAGSLTWSQEERQGDSWDLFSRREDLERLVTGLFAARLGPGITGRRSTSWP